MHQKTAPCLRSKRASKHHLHRSPIRHPNSFPSTNQLTLNQRGGTNPKLQKTNQAQETPDTSGQTQSSFWKPSSPPKSKLQSSLVTKELGGEKSKTTPLHQQPNQKKNTHEGSLLMTSQSSRLSAQSGPTNISLIALSAITLADDIFAASRTAKTGNPASTKASHQNQNSPRTPKLANLHQNLHK